jgi:hypothetical protein
VSHPAAFEACLRQAGSRRTPNTLYITDGTFSLGKKIKVSPQVTDIIIKHAEKHRIPFLQLLLEIHSLRLLRRVNLLALSSVAT